MTTPSLDERRKEVLRSLVELHVETGRARRVGEPRPRPATAAVSPATLRNIMADLEALGYLDHPHTSAGRMPTDEGYRVYVDSLMGVAPARAPRTRPRSSRACASPTPRPTRSWRTPPGSCPGCRGRWASWSCPTSSRRASGTSTSFASPIPRILVVMVSRTGIVTNKVVEVEEQLSQDELQACANYLNAEFAGMRLAADPRPPARADGRGEGPLRLAAQAQPVALGEPRLRAPRATRRASTWTAPRTCCPSPSSTTSSACARSSAPSRRRADW